MNTKNLRRPWSFQFAWIIAVVIGLALNIVPASHAQSDSEASRQQMQQGLMAIQANNLQQGIQQLGRALQLDPENGEAWHYWSYYQHVDGNLEIAIAGFKIAVTFDNLRANSLYNLACCYSLAGDSELALDYLRQAFAAGLSDLNMVASDADLNPLRELPEFRQLIQRAQQGFDQSEQQHRIDRAWQLANAGEMLIQFEFYESAKQKLRQSVRLDVLDGTGIVNLGLAYHQLGDLDRGIEQFEAAADYPEARMIALYNLACAYALKAEPDTAMDYLRQSVEAGFDQFEYMQSDADLASLTGRADFKQLMAAQTTSHPPAIGINSTVTTTTKVDVQSGDDVIGSIPENITLKVLQTENQWLLVEIPGDGKKGWIDRSDVKLASMRVPPSRNSGLPNDPNEIEARQQELLALVPQFTAMMQEGRSAAAARLIDEFMQRNEELIKEQALYPELTAMLGSVYLELQDIPKAQVAFEKAIAAHLKLNGKQNLTYTQIAESLARCKVITLDFEEAERLYEETIEIRKKMAGETDPQYAIGLVNYAAYLGVRGDADRGKPVFLKAMEILAENPGKSDPVYIQAAMQLALFYQTAGQLDEAEQLLIQLVETAKQHHPSNLVYPNSMLTLANHYMAVGDFQLAEPFVQDAVEVIKDGMGENSTAYINSMITLGTLYGSMNEFARSESIFATVRDLAEKVVGQDSVPYTESLYQLAELYSAQGSISQAESLHQEALKIREQIHGEDHPFTANSLTSLAAVYGQMGAVDRVEPLLQRALRINDRIFGPDNVASATILNLLGTFHFKQRDLQKAEQYIQRAGAIFQKIFAEDSIQVAMIHQNLAEIYTLREEWDRAEEYFQKALPVFKNSIDHLYAETLHNHGLLLRKQKRFDEAAENYRISNRILERTFGDEHPRYAEGLKQLALLTYQQEKFDEVTQLVQQYRISVRKHTAKVLPGLPAELQLAYLQNEFRPGLLTSLALGYQLKNNARARVLSAGWLLNGKMIAQEVMAEGALLSTSEAAPLVHNLRSVRNQLSKLTLNLESDETRRRLQLEQIADLETQQDELVRQIGGFSRGGRGSRDWISIGQLREALPLGSVMINIARFDIQTFDGDWPNDSPKAAPSAENEHYVAWLIPSVGSGEIQIVDLGPAAPIDESIRAFRQQIEATPDYLGGAGEKVDMTMRQPLERLSKQLIEPIRPSLEDTHELVVSPDGPLWLVPWGALKSGPNRFLVEDYQIRYSLSGRELVADQVQRSLVGPPAIIADPDYDLRLERSSDHRPGPTRGLNASFGRLPGTADEAREIRPVIESYCGKSSTILMRDKATESHLKQLHRPVVLVISTHGFFLPPPTVATSPAPAESGDLEVPVLVIDVSTRGHQTNSAALPDNPLLRCGLALAGCNDASRFNDPDQEDGILTGLEIVGCDFRGTELVVLSACETGLGDVDAGEGVAGLRQAFQLAGAESVVASLWQVPDAETAEMMKRFWEHLSQGRSKSDALQAAQVAMIDKLRSSNEDAYPFFWAAFTLTGK